MRYPKFKALLEQRIEQLKQDQKKHCPCGENKSQNLSKYAPERDIDTVKVKI